MGLREIKGGEPTARNTWVILFEDLGSNSGGRMRGRQIGNSSMQGAGAATSTACTRARCKDGALHRAGARDTGGGELRRRQRWDLRGARRGSVACDGGARGAPKGGRGAGDRWGAGLGRPSGVRQRLSRSWASWSCVVVRDGGVSLWGRKEVN